MKKENNYKLNKKFLLKIVVSSVLMFLLFLKIDTKNLFENIQLLNWSYVPIIIVFLILNYVISSIRWKYLLIHNNAKKVPLSYLISLYFVGSFFNNFMFTSIGGDVYKIYKLGKKIESNADAFSATFMERFTGLISLVFISLIGFMGVVIGSSSYVEKDIYKIMGITVVLVFLFVVFIYFGLKLLFILSVYNKYFLDVSRSLYVYKGKWEILGVAFASSFIVQFLAIFTQYFIFMAIGRNLDIFRILFIFPMITLATFLIPSLNGIGVQDFLYKFSNTFLFISEPIAIAGSVLYHLFRLVVSLIGGIIYAMDKD